MKFLRPRLWLRLLFRRQTLATALSGVSAVLLLALIALFEHPEGRPKPDVPIAPDPPLAVIPASHTGDAPTTLDLAPDVLRLQAAIQQAGTATTGREGLARSLALLTAGCNNLEEIPDYTSTFVRRERIDGVLKERESLSVKLRHKPFAIYLNWTEGPDAGRELIFAEGQNDGDMIVHPGGWKGRLLPPIKLNPHGSVAKSSARHPVTDLGLVAIGRRIIEKRTPDLKLSGGYRFTMDENSEFEGRPAYRCELVYDSASVSDFFRKAVYYIDRELLISVAVSHYAWPDAEGIPADRLDEETLVEDYLFTNLRFRVQLAEADFDATNEEYHFRR